MRSNKEELKLVLVDRLSDSTARLFKGAQLAKGLNRVKESALGQGGQIEDLNVMLETLS